MEFYAEGEDNDFNRSDRSDITGRFPANLIHDNSEEVRECFPETKTGAVKNFTISTEDKGKIKFTKETYTKERPSDSGNASRFFKSIIYQAKASKSERNKGMEELEAKEWKQENSPNPNREERPFIPVKNNHPTVKPIALMEYLIKMVTPKGGIVLDPFMGSGSTGVACKQNGYDFIGIEMEEEYIKIAEARINY
jgi:site-specific DNA-methyltransferase (adenine-specific)